MMLTACEISEGETFPRGYGIAWWEPHRMVAVCLPVPFNRIVGACRAWYLEWRRPCADDPIVRAFLLGVEQERVAACRREQDAYQSGYDQALRLARQIIRAESDRSWSVQ